MVENSFTDLKIVLILTFLSVIILFIPSLNQYPQNIISYALLLLFLPGYSIFAALKPSVNEGTVWKSIIYSVGLGAVLILAVYLLWTYTPLMTYLTPLINYLDPLEAYIAPLETYMPIEFILSTILIVDLVLIAWVRRTPVLDLTPEIPETTPETGDKKERYVWCKNCNGYYKLEEDESPDDFESCHCGGKLVYTEKLEGEPFRPEQEIKPIQKGSYYLDLLLVLVVTIISLVILQFVNQPDFNTIIEFLLILFLPGYALISMVYLRKDDFSGFSRVAYSFASSIALTTLIGLVLNYSNYIGLLNPILYVLSGLTLVFLLGAYLRRRSIREENRFSIDFIGSFKGLGKGFSGETGIEKLLSLVLVISLVLVVSTTYITANPLEETYTDFYVLGADGNPVNSINLTSNETDNLNISIVNHENKNTTYRVLITSSGTVLLDQTVTLKNEERKDINFNFTVGEPGTREMEFNLYKLPDNDNIYKSIKIPLNVAVNPALIVEEVPII